MGSGASNLNDEQRAHVAKLMKENYEKSVNTVPPEEMQKHMEKLYEELLTSLKPAAPLDAQRHENMKKKQTPTRRRSFGDDKSKKKNLPPKPPARTESNSHHEPQPTHHHEGDHAASHEEAPPHNEENGLYSI